MPFIDFQTSNNNNYNENGRTTYIQLKKIIILVLFILRFISYIFDTCSKIILNKLIK